jgi:hypothetical protein
MTQLSGTDAGTLARDLVANVVEHATEYAGAVADEARTVAGDVVNKAASTASRAAHETTQRTKRATKKATRKAKRATRSSKRSGDARRNAGRALVVLVAAAGVGFVVYRLVRGSDRMAADDRPPVTHFGPEAGTPSDVPGPAYDPEGSAMRAEASGSGATRRTT